jgi:hypothetical protein
MMPLKETAIGTAATQMARAVTHNLANLDKQSIELLRAALKDYNSGKDENNEP